MPLPDEPTPPPLLGEQFAIQLEGGEDCTVRPCRIPADRLRLPSEPLPENPKPEELSVELCLEGGEATTTRPLRPGFSIFWLPGEPGLRRPPRAEPPGEGQ